MAASEESIALLRSIDATLKALLELSRQRMTKPVNGVAGGKVASDRDLDGKYGDPVVKAKDPRDWNGPTMKGRKFSQCPPEYLDMVADRLDFFATQSEKDGKKTNSGKPVADYERADAARARGWAARMRAGKSPAPEVEESPGWSVTDDDPEIQH